MKRTYLYILTISFFLAACGQGSGSQDQQDTTAVAKTAEIDTTAIPGIEKVPFTDTISLKANDDMHFDKDLFKIKSGKKIILRLTNIGSQAGKPMAHNVVILNKGTDISNFADAARQSEKDQYIPPAFASSIIAHTKSVIAGKSDEVKFTITQPGVYDFICSYPGHWGTMQGKIVVE
jgi:azurin